jgi:hypothetical protein
MFFCVYLYCFACYGISEVAFFWLAVKYSNIHDQGRYGVFIMIHKYSSYSFLTSALDGVSGQCHVPAVREEAHTTYCVILL